MRKDRKAIMIPKFFLWVGVAIAAGVWPLNATLNLLFIDGTSFTKELLHPDGREIALRLAFGMWAIGFGAFAQHRLTKISHKEATSRERETRMRRVMDNVDAVLWMVSPDFEDLIHVSPAYESVFGRSIESLRHDGRDWVGAVHPDDVDRIKATMKQDGGIGELRETYRIIRPDGEVRWLESHSVPVHDEDGKIYGIAGLSIDVTGRMIAEEEVQQLNHELERRVSLRSEELNLSELRYRTLTSASPVGIFQSNAQGDTVYINPRGCEIVGMTAEEALEGWPNALHPEDRDRIRGKWLRHVESGEVFEDEYRFVHKDGKVVWVFGQIVPQKDLDGNISGFVGVITDITQLKKAEQRIHTSEKRFQTLAKVSPTGIFRADTQGKCIYVNEAYCEISGFALSETLDQGWANAIHPEDREGLVRTWDEAINERINFEDECRVLRKDGSERWVLVQATAEVNDADEVVGYVGTITDITWRKQSEKAVRESEKLAAIGRMAARIAHEINNPLAGIANAFSLVKDAIPEDHVHYEYVELIEDEVSRIAEIVQHMFEMYEPSRQSPRTLVLDEVFSDVALLFEAGLRQGGVCLEFDVLDGPPDVTLPETYFRQIVNSLVANAIEASPPGGRVLVRTEAHGEELHLYVSDQGRGIPQDIQHEIFEPFFSTKGGQTGKCMGLGLSLALSMAKAMEGSVELRECDAEGTTFRLRIPRSVSAEVLGYV